jgi:hypothetical protein
VEERKRSHHRSRCSCRALAFYRDGLGFRTEGLIGTEFTGDESIPDGTTAVFHLDGGLMLSVYPRSELAKDAIIPLTAATHRRDT